MKDACFTTEYGKQIFYLNFSYDSIDDAIPLIDECAKQVRQRPTKSVSTLTTISRGNFMPALVDRLKDLTKGNEPYVRRAAVVGVVGLYKVVITAISIFSKRDFKIFENKQDAIRCLLED